MGAIGEGGVLVVNDDLVRAAGVSTQQFQAVVDRERAELTRRAALYRGDRGRLALKDKLALIVDDGVATGSTASAACEVARQLGARRVVLATPVGPARAQAEMSRIADEVVFLETPPSFDAVGRWYRDFSPTSDDEVVDLLRSPGEATPRAWTGARPVSFAVDRVRLEGDLVVPEGASGLVLFAHGSGSSRKSPRNRAVAEVLQEAGIGTLLFDLLTPDEEGARANVFDVDLLGSRLAGVTRSLTAMPQLRDLPVGYFGASTGAAAAMWAAAEPDLTIAAVVSRGGRPDLTGPRLRAVTAPTLLIVGERDHVVIELNQQAASELRCPHELVVVQGATHVFPEPGALEAVARLARGWFMKHLGARAAPLLSEGARR
jgi:putative phosphoribosyl transferase